MSALGDSLLLIVALLLVALNGFFVAAEFAIVKVRHTRVAELQRQHGLRGRVLAAVHANLDAYLSACQLGITLASLGLGWVGEPAFARLLATPLAMLGFDEPDRVHLIAFLVAFATISYLHIVLGELAPKSAALRQPEGVSLWTAVPLFVFYWLMYPFIRILNASANGVLRGFGLEARPGHGNETPYSLEELRVILHLSHMALDRETGESEMNRLLTHALELPKLHASDVMRNRRELVCVRSDDEWGAVRRLLQLHRFSRYPYVEADSGTILGLLHFKDIAFELGGADFLQRLGRNVLPIERVREDLPVNQLLRLFRLGAPHLALVEDGQGQVIGFVTMEDALEAVIGDIRDEHSGARVLRVDREPQWLEDGSLLVRGDTPLYQLERELGIALPESGEFSTVAGLLMERLGHLPKAGEEFDLDRFRARVLRVRGATIESMHLRAMAAEPPADQE